MHPKRQLLLCGLLWTAAARVSCCAIWAYTYRAPGGIDRAALIGMALSMAFRRPRWLDIEVRPFIIR